MASSSQSEIKTTPFLKSASRIAFKLEAGVNSGPYRVSAKS